MRSTLMPLEMLKAVSVTAFKHVSVNKAMVLVAFQFQGFVYVLQHENP